MLQDLSTYAQLFEKKYFCAFSVELNAVILSVGGLIYPFIG